MGGEIIGLPAEKYRGVSRGSVRYLADSRSAMGKFRRPVAPRSVPRRVFFFGSFAFPTLRSWASGKGARGTEKIR